MKVSLCYICRAGLPAVTNLILSGLGEAPAEVLSSDGERAVPGQGKQAVPDVVGLPEGLWDSFKQV